MKVNLKLYFRYGKNTLFIAFETKAYLTFKIIVSYHKVK